MAFMSVDLPAPLAPMSPTISAALDVEGCTVHGHEAAEADAQIANREHRAGRHGGRGLPRRCRTTAARWGAPAAGCSPTRLSAQARIASRSRVGDLVQTTREVQQDDEQAQARAEQAEQSVVRGDGGDADDERRHR